MKPGLRITATLAFALLFCALDAGAQRGSSASAAPPPPGPFQRGYLPETFQPPEEFATSSDHYEFLLDMYRGGVRHTHESVPKWEGVWSPASNNSGNRLFLNQL